MKKLAILLVCLLLLTGFAQEPSLETVNDEILQPVMTQVYSPVFTLPRDAAVTTMESPDAGTIYFCDGYTVTLRTLPGGDLDRTVVDTTGFSEEDLTLLKTRSEGFQRIQCVWSAVSEEGEQLGRLTVLDDGANHHVLSCMTPAADAAALAPEIQQLMDSFRLVTPEALDTGS